MRLARTRAAVVLAALLIFVPSLHAATLRPLRPADAMQGYANPAWSPDGTHLAASHWQLVEPLLFLAEYVSAYEVESGEWTDLQGLTQVPSHPDYPLVMDPTWSPDGSHVAVVSHSSLWVAGVANTEAFQVNPEEARQAAWSPDGARIAYESGNALRVAPATGGPGATLTTGKSPAWSHDGVWIAFHRGGDLWKVPSQGGAEVRLTQDPAEDSEPSWSPDGAFLAFVSNREGQSDIWVLRIATGQMSRLTNDAAVDASPAWSPEGERIAYISFRDGEGGSIWIATDLRTIAVEPTSWSAIKSQYR